MRMAKCIPCAGHSTHLSMNDRKPCSACSKEIDPKNEGIEVFGSWFCSMCFIGRAQSFHKELKPDDIALLRIIAKELSGLMPGDLLEMILVGYWRRSTGRTDEPPRDETLRVAGELQRLTAFANFAATLRLLKSWRDIFNDFVDEQEKEIREKVKRLTDAE